MSLAVAIDSSESSLKIKYGGVKVSTGFMIDMSACPGSAGLVKKRKTITANSNVINAAARFVRPSMPMARAA